MQSLLLIPYDNSMVLCLLQAVAPKKKLNIPTCDVKTDDAYDANVKASFKQPQCYVRYVRKVGDESDMSADYFMDRDDMLWIAGNEKLTSDKEAQRFLTHDSFEAIIDHLERLTGMAKDPVTLVSTHVRILPPMHF